MRLLYFMLILSIALPCVAQTQDGKDWVQLFNGKNLDGWIPKIAGYEVGENFGNTFRVKDGVMQTGYEAYGPFNQRFGLLSFP